MNRQHEIKTCGRDPSCDLVLADSTLSRLHARIELAGDGLVSINDAGSSNGTFVNRNDSWIRARRVILCIGDRIRFGEIEVPLERLTAIFGKRANIRLEAGRFPIRRGKAVAMPLKGRPDQEVSRHKPRRNPVTGKIEAGKTEEANTPNTQP
jgi:predicted component of type VI protein secretion system